MNELPEHLRRYPTRAGRDALATRLGLTINPNSQDWEWEVADPEQFDKWLTVYHDAPLSDDERFSLMEMLIQCVEDMMWIYEMPSGVEELPQWQMIAALLHKRPLLHASSIAYWSVFGHEDPEEVFRVSVPMRGVWAAIQVALVWQRHRIRY